MYFSSNKLCMIYCPINYTNKRRRYITTTNNTPTPRKIKTVPSVTPIFDIRQRIMDVLRSITKSAPVYGPYFGEVGVDSLKTAMLVDNLEQVFDVSVTQEGFGELMGLPDTFDFKSRFSW
eukprot:TRINITY_DN7669_c0_g1_i1.p2 TRINITY_DN7669_c0_g1~~TRINITY_DN7669_c0_g1_i1.p2  ORF type:complete len:120 (-),score=15.10 TRINITY_DN7669_c0_g1_i1:83-442(-)